MSYTETIKVLQGRIDQKFDTITLKYSNINNINDEEFHYDNGIVNKTNLEEIIEKLLEKKYSNLINLDVKFPDVENLSSTNYIQRAFREHTLIPKIFLPFFFFKLYKDLEVSYKLNSLSDIFVMELDYTEIYNTLLYSVSEVIWLYYKSEDYTIGIDSKEEDQYVERINAFKLMSAITPLIYNIHRDIFDLIKKASK